MAQLRCIVYVSNATRELQSAEIDALLQGSRRFNASHGITGVLLYAYPTFLQLLEGEAGQIDETLQRVRAASAHSSVRVLFDGVVDERHFGAWHMALVRPPQSDLQAIALADWKASIDLGAGRVESLGLELVTECWKRWSARDTGAEDAAAG